MPNTDIGKSLLPSDSDTFSISKMIYRLLFSMNERIGQSLAWLTALMAVTIFGLVISRTIFGIGSIATQESITYMHSAVLMLCMAYTAQHGGHVRVDIVYRRFNPEQKAWVNAIGALLFLIPFAIFLIGISWHFTLEAWRILEGSNNPAGIPAVFLLKTMIPLAGLLLFLFALGELIKHTLIICFNVDPSENT